MAKNSHNDEWIIQFAKAEDAWLRQDTTSINIPRSQNPLFKNRTKDDLDNPGLHELRVFTNPRYLWAAARYFLNVNLLPEQVVILQELWLHPFPMFIASRGFGKMLKGSEKIRVQNGWKRMKDIRIGDKVYGSDGKLCNVVGKTEKQKNLNMYRLTLRDGRTIECCEDHQWKVWDKNKNREKKVSVWTTMKTKDMVEKYRQVRIGEKSNGLEYIYALPINNPLVEDDKKEFSIDPYVLGVILGDGSITSHTACIESMDDEVISEVQKRVGDHIVTCTANKNKKSNSYRITGKSNGSYFIEHVRKLGLHGTNSHTKFIPEKYKYGDYQQRLDLLCGLMDTDGCAKKFVIEYTTVSKRLANDVLDLARSLGIHCKLILGESKCNGKLYGTKYRIYLYTKLPIFKLQRKLDNYIYHDISKQGKSKYEKVFITNIEYIGKGDGYCIEVDSPDNTYITKDYIVTHNSFLLSVYCMLRCLFTPPNESGGPGCKIVIVGSAFRQSKILFDYMTTIWNNAPILRDIAKQGSNKTGPKAEIDRCTMYICSNWIACVPLGNGEKIRGLRATTVLADEFNSINPEIYETVVAGFAAVSADPVKNVQEWAKREKMMQSGTWSISKEQEFRSRGTNQSILSGTCGYDFEAYADYWKKYSKLIKEDKHEDYSIIRIPYELIPKGFMDEKVVERAKATVHTAIYQKEYGTIFVKDSDGFFKRSLIESCVANDKNVHTPDWQQNCKWCLSPFDPLIRGQLGYHYVMGVDPASESDNFSIVVLEMHNNHQRVVHCWSTNREDFKIRKRSGSIDDTDFYGYCARKIRNLEKVFPCLRIGIDVQGGGIAVMEALMDEDKMHNGELKFLPIIEDNKEKDTDNLAGRHIIEPIQFAKADWVSEANHGLRKDMEDKLLLFSRFDSVTLEMSLAQDKIRSEEFEQKYGKKLHLYDTLEDCVLNIEELKNELSTIIITRTGYGNNARDRWDTPDTKLPGQKKGPMKKDRYSALLIANMLARQSNRELPQPAYDAVGGYVGGIVTKNHKNGKVYEKGPAWLTECTFNPVAFSK